MIAAHRHEDFAPAALLARKREPISVVLPARDEQATIAGIVRAIRSLGPLVDQVVVIDSESSDRTAELAAAAGAEVHRQSELVPAAGTPRGKGDAMWRALAVVRGEIVVYLDADTRRFRPHFVTGLVGPLLAERPPLLVKATYRRPFVHRGGVAPDGGGRVTELCARPLLRALYPPLAALGQPLAGEVAARRSLLESLPFATGYAVEVAMLIDVLRRHGPAAIAQVDLGERVNAHQPLARLGPMADTIVAAILDRLGREGRLPAGVAPRAPLEQRPPWISLRAAPRAAAAPAA